MTGRSGVRLTVGILAALAAGCGSSRPFQQGIIARAADKNPPDPIDNRYGSVAAPPSAASSWPPAPSHAPPPPPASTWPQADYTRTSYAEELGAGQPTGEPILPPRPSAPPAYYGGGYDRGPVPADPHVRQRPTATGGMFDLGPNETAMDRATELARKIEQVNKENLALLARIRQLESAAEARETSLNETLRDVQNTSDEVTRTRADIQNLRKELAALRNRVLQVEKDEAETMKAVIMAVDKLQQKLQEKDKK